MQAVDGFDAADAVEFFYQEGQGSSVGDDEREGALKEAVDGTDVYRTQGDAGFFADERRDVRHDADLVVAHDTQGDRVAACALAAPFGGITKKITSHLARHTFATTITLSKGVPIETVSKMLGHTNLTTTQIYARILNSKISNDMEALAGKMKKLDMKLQFSAGQDTVSIENIIKSLKIPSGRVSDVIWENLVAKVWNKLSNIEKQAFASDVTGMENKPKTLCDFYVCLIDYFLENRTDNRPLNENTLIDNAVNF